MLEVELLGPCRFVVDGEQIDLGTPKQTALAAAIAARFPAVVSRDRLIDDLWGERPPASVGSTFAGYLSNLRRSLEPARRSGEDPSVLVTRRPGYVLEVPPSAVDLVQFRSLVSEADQLEASSAIELIERALRLVKGPAMENARSTASLEALASRIDEEVVAAGTRRFELLVDNGLARPEEIQETIEEHPFREHLRALHARALYQQGRQADALRAVASAREMMAEELGLDPSPELRQLEIDLLEQATSLLPAPPDGVAAPQPSAEPVAVPVPASDPIFGREREMTVIHQALDDLAAGKGTLLLISGEIGTGKSHLLLQLLDEADRRGMTTGAGIYTAAAGRPPLSAWNDARRTIATKLGPRLAEITPPELLEAGLEFVGGDIQGDFSGSALYQVDRLHKFLDVMRASAWHMSQHERLVIALDDFHLADDVSFAAVESWGRAVENSAVLLVATYRELDLLDVPGCERWLRTITSAPRTRRISLAGLNERATGELAASLGVTLSRPELTQLHQRTDGNPLLVSQLGRLAVSEAAANPLAAELPRELLSVVRQRLSQTESGVIDVLTTASLAESSINPEIDAVVLDLDPDVVDDRMLQAVADGFLVHDPSVPGNYRFANALTREALASSIGPRRRARLHASLGDALVASDALDSEATIAAARHYCLGARSGTAQKGAELALLAGQQSIEASGYSTAYSIFTLGLDAMAFDASIDVGLKLELLRWRGLAGQAIGLGSTALTDQLDAFGIAKELDDPVAGAEVALAAREGSGTLRARLSWNPGPPSRAMLRDAAATLRSDPPDERPALLPDLLSACACDGLAGSSLDDANDMTELVALADEAVEIARSDCEPFLPDALIRRALSGWFTTAPAALLHMVDQAIEAAVEQDNLDIEMMARSLGCTLNIELADIEQAEQRLAVGNERVELARLSATRNSLVGLPATLLSVTGRPAEAEGLARGHLERAQAMGPYSADRFELAVVASRFLAGPIHADNLSELWPADVAERRPSLAAVSALLHVEAGLAEAARHELERFEHREHLRTETAPHNGLGWAAALATRAHLGDLDETAELYQRLSALAGRQIIPGFGAFYFLPVDYFLGLGAVTLSEHKLADEHFTRAVKWAEKVGSRQTIDRVEHVGS